MTLVHKGMETHECHMVSHACWAKQTQQMKWELIQFLEGIIVILDDPGWSSMMSGHGRPWDSLACAT